VTWLTWRFPCYLAALAAVEVAVDLAAAFTTLGTDDPIGAGFTAIALMWVGAVVVALTSTVRSGPRWAEWGIAVALFVIGVAAVDTVRLGLDPYSSFISQMLLWLTFRAVIYVSAVATGLCLALGWSTARRFTRSYRSGRDHGEP
jgi:hypothetical protein